MASTTMATTASSSSSSTSSSGSRKLIMRGGPSAKTTSRIEKDVVDSQCSDDNQCRVEQLNAVDVEVKCSSIDIVSAPSSSSSLSSTRCLDYRYVTSFHGFLKVTALVSCLGAASSVATADQCWYEAGMALHILWSLSIVSFAWTLIFYGGHLLSFQRRFQKKISKTSTAVVFTDVVLSAFSFVSMMVAGFVTANSGCQIERSVIIGSASFGILASILYFVNFVWLTSKYYLDFNLTANN